MYIKVFFSWRGLGNQIQPLWQPARTACSGAATLILHARQISPTEVAIFRRILLDFVVYKKCWTKLDGILWGIRKTKHDQTRTEHDLPSWWVWTHLCKLWWFDSDSFIFHFPIIRVSSSKQIWIKQNGIRKYSPPARWGLLDFIRAVCSSSSSSSLPSPPPGQSSSPILFAKCLANPVRQASRQSSWQAQDHSEHRWTWTGRVRVQWAPLDLNRQIECQNIWQIQCQTIW